MDAKTIQKYAKKTVSQLKKIAERWFNLFIRLRDCDQYGNGRCISSGRPEKFGSGKWQAGHFIPGTCSPLKFNENNVHGQSLADNYYAHADLINYRRNLVKKIGEEAVKEIEQIELMSKRSTWKWDRFYLIEIIEKYKIKAKELQKEKMF